MLVSSKAQKPIPLGGITGDDVHIWDPDLRDVDEILTDDSFIDILWSSFLRVSECSPSRGAPRMALNRILRMGALKHIRNLSLRALARDAPRNLDFRAFTQFFEEKVKSVSALSRNLALADAQAVRELNERLCEIAIEQGVIKGRKLRQDTTVCESNIHYPNDSSLLQDGVRVAQRLAERAEELAPSIGRMRDRSRAVLHRVLEINRASRSRKSDASERRERSYRALLRISRSVATEASKIADKLGDGRVTRHLKPAERLAAGALRGELQTMLPRIEKVIRQTRVRICRGITNSPDKILSLFVPKTCVIRKGKAGKSAEFGRLIDIVEVENGYVSDYQILDGNPDDGSLLIPALQRHKERFGRAPHTVATDRGFWSAKNEKQAHALGVKRVSIPARGKLSKTRLRIQRSRWFREAQRWRSNGEGRIGTLKNQHGLDRCRCKGEDAMERWVGWCVFANNLLVVARVIRKRKEQRREDVASTSGAQADEAA